MSDTQENEKYYSAKKQKIVIIIMIFFVFVICCFGLPWGIWGLSKLFSEFGWTNDDVGGLTNFLGGLFGVFLGFFIEGWLIGQWKQLSRYNQLILCLKRELLGVYKVCEVCKTGTAKSIEMWVFKDIVSSAENETIFYSLPRYFIKVPIKGRHVELLHDINGVANEINSGVGKALENNTTLSEKFKENYSELQKKIKLFFKLAYNKSVGEFN